MAQPQATPTLLDPRESSSRSPARNISSPQNSMDAPVPEPFGKGHEVETLHHACRRETDPQMMEPDPRQSSRVTGESKRLANRERAALESLVDEPGHQPALSCRAAHRRDAISTSRA
jgi:hypothetical protein